MLGFSGVLASYVGMIMGLIFTHCTYLQNRFQAGFCMIVVMMVILSIMVIGFGPALLIHLYGYVIGILLGVAFLPKHMNTDLSSTCDKIMKAVAIGVCLIIIIVAFIVWSYLRMTFIFYLFLFLKYIDKLFIKL